MGGEMAQAYRSRVQPQLDVIACGLPAGHGWKNLSLVNDGVRVSVHRCRHYYRRLRFSTDRVIMMTRVAYAIAAVCIRRLKIFVLAHSEGRWGA